MVSPVVATILMIGINFTVFGSLVAFATADHYTETRCHFNGDTPHIWDTTDCLPEWEAQWQEYAEECRCEPPREPSGKPCEPVSLPDRFAVAWRCEIKPKAMRY